MRISDWSSDVCSSDLLDSGPPWSCRGVVRGFAPNSQPVDKIHPLWISDGAESARRGMNRACRLIARAFAKLIQRGNESPTTRSIIAFFRGFPPWWSHRSEDIHVGKQCVGQR